VLRRPFAADTGEVRPSAPAAGPGRPVAEDGSTSWPLEHRSTPCWPNCRRPSKPTRALTAAVPDLILRCAESGAIPGSQPPGGSLAGAGGLFLAGLQEPARRLPASSRNASQREIRRAMVWREDAGFEAPSPVSPWAHGLHGTNEPTPPRDRGVTGWQAREIYLSLYQERKQVGAHCTQGGSMLARRMSHQTLFKESLSSGDTLQPALAAPRARRVRDSRACRPS